MLPSEVREAVKLLDTLEFVHQARQNDSYLTGEVTIKTATRGTPEFKLQPEQARIVLDVLQNHAEDRLAELGVTPEPKKES